MVNEFDAETETHFGESILLLRRQIRISEEKCAVLYNEPFIDLDFIAYSRRVNEVVGAPCKASPRSR